jgi:hypothetical protein
MSKDLKRYVGLTIATGITDELEHDTLIISEGATPAECQFKLLRKT